MVEIYKKACPELAEGTCPELAEGTCPELAEGTCPELAEGLELNFKVVNSPHPFDFAQGKRDLTSVIFCALFSRLSLEQGIYF